MNPLGVNDYFTELKWTDLYSLSDITYVRHIYSVIEKDGLNFVRLYFLNYAWYVNDFLRAKNLVLHSSHFALN